MRDVVGGRYQIVRRLGAGGMATVYLAHDPLLGRDVAIKVPRVDDGADPETLERFQAELRTIGRLNHPNIVTIYDGGQDEGDPYLVMEPVEGESLAQLIRRDAPLPVDRAVDIARQIAEALAYAHGIGLIHRDIKPQNVLLDR
ncbi:MAG: serine/threonine protein kinase, partial [Chloroflexi bacterium]|nr:serine/threonine protein kinase [Chloroflexota bacterium]